MATVPAVLGTARLGNFRLGYESAALATIRRTTVHIVLAGLDVRVRINGLSITDVVNDTPNTCSGIIDSPAPTSGQDFRVTINSDAPRDLFVGAIQQDDLTYEGKPTQLAYPFSAIDDTDRVNYRRPFGTWVTTSATTIAQEITAAYAPGFTAAGVEIGLPLVSIVFDGTKSFMGCLTQLAWVIGGFCNAEEGIVSLFLTDTTDAPDPIDNSHPFCDSPPITMRSDDSQLRTRVCGRGHAEALSMEVEREETVLPIDDVVMYNPFGGKVIASTTPDGAASEILSYTGVQTGGGGALVGPGVTPSVAPSSSATTGTGLGEGVYGEAYTWVTAAGETLPSPVETVLTFVIADPTVAPVITGVSGSWVPASTSIQFAYFFSHFSGGARDTALSPVTTRTINPGDFDRYQWDGTVPNNPGIVSLSCMFSSDGGATWFITGGGLVTPGAAFSFTGVVGVGLGSAAPTNNATCKQLAVAGIAIGPSSTTQRKVYRTAVQTTVAAALTAQLKLQQTIANNTATVGVQDATADGSLGANAPTSDTSGLTSTSGQINAGSTSILTSGTGPYSASGGWVRTSAGELVRYTGISGNSLTGIPASGVGAILTSILYGSQVIPVPALTGVTGLTKTLRAGAPVHIWVQRDDLGAQAAAAIRESTASYTSDGIHDFIVIDDRRGEDSLIEICDAHLALFSYPIVTVTYATRDVKTKAGKTVHVNVASPPIGPIDLTIQAVTITEINVSAGGALRASAPKFTVTASSVRFTLEALLRKLAA